MDSLFEFQSGESCSATATAAAAAAAASAAVVAADKDKHRFLSDRFQLNHKRDYPIFMFDFNFANQEFLSLVTINIERKVTLKNLSHMHSTWSIL